MPYNEGVGLMEDSLDDIPECLLYLSIAPGSVSVIQNEGAALTGRDLLAGLEPKNLSLT